jgi:spermidine synthase
VLGVGGGAVIRQLQRFIEPESIVGVERSGIHLDIARRFFGVRGAGVELIEGDAVDWVRTWQGPPFDMIVDDLFGDDDGEPARAVQATGKWVGALVKCLSRDGMIVSNFATRGELTGSAYQQLLRYRRLFKSGFWLATPQNHNAVGVFLRTSARHSDLRQRLCRIPCLNPDRKSTGLRYQLRVLKPGGGSS